MNLLLLFFDKAEAHQRAIEPCVSAIEFMPLVEMTEHHALAD